MQIYISAQAKRDGDGREDLFGTEIDGIKMHTAIDVIFRRNHIHHCSRRLWLDWQAHCYKKGRIL